MTDKEMGRRLNTMTCTDIARVRDLLAQAFSAKEIVKLAPFTVPQVKAVAQLKAQGGI